MPDYIRQELATVLPDIKAVRDAARGSNWVKSRRIEYLPVPGEDEAKYEKYLKRAYFVGATGATIKGYTSSVFRKPITVRGDAADELIDIDGVGSGIQAYCNKVFKELLTGGRVSQWIAPLNDNFYLMPYKSEQHINWIPEQFTVLYEKARKGTIEIEYVDQLRVIKRMEDGVKIGTQALNSPIELDDNPSIQLADQPAEDATLPWTGQFPVIPITPDGIGYDPTTIPLHPLAEANFDHYRLSADLRQGLHTAPFPVFFAAGFGTEKELKIGPDKAWVAKGAGPNAAAGVLEYRGYALEWLLQTLTKTEGFLISFGARMLEHDKRASETAEALRTRQASQEANIIGLVRACSAGITLGCRTLLAYRNKTTIDRIDLAVDLPTDLIETRLTSDELIALVTAWVKGAITDDQLEFNYRQGELIEAHQSKEEYLAELNKARLRAEATQARMSITAERSAGNTDAGRPSANDG